VDIDLNYVGAADRETMLAERPKVEQAIEAVCSRLGLRLRRAPSDHAGGKWRLSYATVTGRPGTLELDMNFLLRTPLWPHVVRDSRPVGTFAAADVTILDLHELAAGKLAALFARNAGRSPTPPRVVLDTNLVLSTLVFSAGTLVALRRSWQSQRCTPLVSNATAGELIRVLAYRKFRLNAEERESL
jgi:hypothetical protein